MQYEVAYLQGEKTYIVILEEFKDHYNVAKCNSDGRVHDSKKYTCNIPKRKLKWRTVKLDEKIKFERERIKEKPKEIVEEDKEDKEDVFERAEKWAEQNTVRKLVEGLNLTTSQYKTLMATKNKKTEKILEDFMKDKEVLELDLKKTGKKLRELKNECGLTVSQMQLDSGVSYQSLEKAMKNIEIRPHVERQIIEYLNNTNYRKVDNIENLSKRLRKYKKDKSLTYDEIAQSFDCNRYSIDNLLYEKISSRDIKVKIDKELEKRGY